MKFKIFLIFIIISVFIVMGMSLQLIPYHFYQLALQEGITSDYIKLSKLNPRLWSGKNEEIQNVEKGAQEYFQTLWKDFHFNNILVSFPVHHHQLQIIPFLRDRQGGRPFLGAKFVDSNQQEIFSFIEETPFPFKVNMDKEKIFSFPVVRQAILSKNWETIWRDFFVYNVNLTQDRSWFPWGEKSMRELGHDALFYGLFMMNMRLQYMDSEKIQSLSFLTDKQIGVLEHGDIDERFTSQTIWLFNNGMVYPMVLRMNRGEPLSQVLRDRFLEKVDFQSSSPDSAIKIYADYKNLPYRSRISQEGMVYLYACFSHNPSEKEFLQEMIQFLERGSDNVLHLKPLLDYALARFGSTLSVRLDRVEDAHSRLERKISEESNQERSDAMDKKTQSPDENFMSPEDKVQFYLNKAKESAINSDTQDARLEQ